MVDIHTHILPGLDDGSRSLEESVDMAVIAAENGLNHIVASSHGNCFPYSMEEYWEQFRNLQSELRNRQIPVTLYPGMEIYLDEDAQELLEKQELLSINNTRNLLVEFPMEEESQNICRRIAEIQKMEYTVILAHPERYVSVQREPELAYYLEEEGCVLQINAESLLGKFGTAEKRVSRQMLRDGIVGVIATDAHDSVYRKPSVRRVREHLSKYYPSQLIHLWLSENPSRILKGYPILDAKRDRIKEYKE